MISTQEPQCPHPDHDRLRPTTLEMDILGQHRHLALRTSIDFEALRKRRLECSDPCKGGFHNPLEEFCKHRCDPEAGVHIGRCLHELSMYGFPIGPIPCSIRCLKPSGIVKKDSKVPSCAVCDGGLYAFGCGFYPLSAQLRDFITYGLSVCHALNLDYAPPNARDEIQHALNDVLIELVYSHPGNTTLARLRAALPRGGQNLWFIPTDLEFQRIVIETIAHEISEWRRVALEALTQRIGDAAESELQRQFEQERLFPGESKEVRDMCETGSFDGPPDYESREDILAILEFKTFGESEPEVSAGFINDILQSNFVHSRLRTMLEGKDTKDSIWQHKSIKSYEVAAVIFERIIESVWALEPGLEEYPAIIPDWLKDGHPIRCRRLLVEAIGRGTREAATILYHDFVRKAQTEEGVQRYNIACDEDYLDREANAIAIDALISESAGYWTMPDIKKYVKALENFGLRHSINSLSQGLSNDLPVALMPAFFSAELVAQVGADRKTRLKCSPVFKIIDDGARKTMYKYIYHGANLRLTALAFVQTTERDVKKRLMDMSRESIRLLCQYLEAAQVSTQPAADADQVLATARQAFLASL